MSYEPGSHQPPKFLLRHNGEVEDFNDAESAKARLQEMMDAHPGEFIDVYVHSQAVRKPQENSNEA